MTAIVSVQDGAAHGKHSKSGSDTSTLELPPAAAAALIPAHRGTHPHGPRRASLLGPGAAAAAHVPTGLRTPSQLQADGDEPTAPGHSAESGQGESTEASAALQHATAMEKLSHQSHSGHSNSQHLPAVVESPVESARNRGASHPGEASDPSASLQGIKSTTSVWGRWFGRSSVSSSSVSANASRPLSAAQDNAHQHQGSARPAARPVESPGEGRGAPASGSVHQVAD